MKYKLSTKTVIVAPNMSAENLKRLAPYYQKEPIFDLPEGAQIINQKQVEVGRIQGCPTRLNRILR